ncbi:MAG: GNAT family N-acetyltransferase [Anaerolineae bacterium]
MTEQVDSYVIRDARPDDLPLLPTIERAAVAQFQATPYAFLADADLLSTKVDLDHEFVWVVVDGDDQPVGFAIVHLLDTAVHLHEIDIHPQHARQGLGRRLIEHIAQWARARGAAALTLTTFSDVPWNGPYYGRLGFRTLDVATLRPELQKVWEVETAVGLPMTNRICMQLDL